MKVVLIKPRHPEGSEALRFFETLPIPLGLLQLAADVKAVEENAEVKVIDMEAEKMNVKSLVNYVSRINPDIVGITLRSTATHNVSLEIAKGIKEQSPHTLLVAGGYHATFVPTQLLKGSFDVVVLGEGDETIMELVKAVENHDDFSKVKGIVYKDGEGKIRKTPPRPLVRNLDDLPMPAFDLVDKSKYPLGLLGKGHAVGAIETIRGCPYACDFRTVTPMWGNIWRFKSNKRILAELRELKRLGYDWVFFVDNEFIEFAFLKQRLELFDQMINEGLNFNIMAQLRPDIIARVPEVAKKASDAGMRIVYLGAESADDETLKNTHKGIVSSMTEKAVKILHENGVIVYVFFILGAPYDDLNKMMKNVKFAYRLSDLGADLAEFPIYTPLPGTRAFVNTLKEGKIVTLNWDYYDLEFPVMKTKVNPVLIEFLRYYATHSFFVRKLIRGLFIRQKIPEQKKKVIRQAKLHYVKKIPYHVKEILIEMPTNLIKVWSLHRKNLIKMK